MLFQAFVLLIILEMFWAHRRSPDSYESRDTFTSLAFGLGNAIIGAVFAGSLAAVTAFAYDHRVMTIPFTWWAVLLCVVADDFIYYWFHRFAHRSRFMWASHVNHHSSQMFNFSTALRSSWTGILGLNWLFRLPLFLVGFDPFMILIVGTFFLAYQFWLHTESIKKLPDWFEAFFNTPSHHRVHHGVHPEYLDRNYAGILIVWDKIFGSFQAEKIDTPSRYGIVKQLPDFNLFWCVFHEWIELIADIVRAPWSKKLAYLFQAPGWKHDGTGKTSSEIRDDFRKLQQGSLDDGDT